MHEVLVNRLEGLSLPRKSVVRLTDRPDMTLDVYRGRKTTIQQQQNNALGNFIRANSANIRSEIIHHPNTLGAFDSDLVLRDILCETLLLQKTLRIMKH